MGCYLGGLLSAHADVTLIGRPPAMEAIAANGLTLEIGAGRLTHLDADRFRLRSTASAVAGADLVLVCTKAPDAVAAIRAARPHLSPTALVGGLQNGLHAVDALRDELDHHRVVTIVVSFNVVRTGPSSLVQTTAGQFVLAREATSEPFAELARAAGLPVRVVDDMPAVLHGKVLVTLNNAIQALSGRSLRAELLDRDYRRALALCQTEAVRCFDAAGVVPEVPLTVPAVLLPVLLRTPTPVFRTVARATLRIDERAGSSMADDLARGRRTEIDQLQGVVVAMGRRLDIPTPVCERVVQLVHRAEREGPAYRVWEGSALLAELDTARRRSRVR